MSLSVEERALIEQNHCGHIIDACSWLEKRIEVFILDFFVGERGTKWDLMREVLLDRFHFDGKIPAVRSLGLRTTMSADFCLPYYRPTRTTHFLIRAIQCNPFTTIKQTIQNFFNS